MLFSHDRITQKNQLNTFGLSGLLICAIFANVQAQALKVKMVLSPEQIRVYAEPARAAQSWSFRNAYAGVLGLGDRIKDFEAVGKAGENAVVRKLAAGEYRSDQKATSFAYSVGLPLPSRPGDLSHVSWLASDYGFLMLADLLPEAIGEDTVQEQSVLVEFEVPVGWTVGSSISPSEKNQFVVKEPEAAVFLVGHSLRKTAKTLESMEVEILATGEWPSADAEVLKIAAKVMKKYAELTGFRLPRKSVVMLAPLPASQSTAFWRAETRGSSVILLLDPRAKREKWIPQLGVIFTHEILHLWVPNSLRLKGDYDWFFEGFTLYEALLVALDLKLITFKEYLNTIARVYDSYLSYADDLSLIEASEQRWTTAAPLVYDKGMLVAFIYDLVTRQESDARSSLADRYRALFSSRAAERLNANEVIIGLLRSSAATDGFPKAYIETRNTIQLERVLPAYGLQINTRGPITHLSVGSELSKEQYRLLHSLGYRQ